MQITERRYRHITILALTGDLIWERDLDALDKTIKGLKEQGRVAVVLDLGRLEMINSAGISLLIASAQMFRESDGDLRLARLTEPVYNILVAFNRKGEYFSIYDEVDPAVASFNI